MSARSTWGGFHLREERLAFGVFFTFWRDECVHIVQVPFYFIICSFKVCCVRTGKCFALRQLSDESRLRAEESLLNQQRVEPPGNSSRASQSSSHQCSSQQQVSVTLSSKNESISSSPLLLLLSGLIWPGRRRGGETTLALSLSTWENG